MLFEWSRAAKMSNRAGGTLQVWETKLEKTIKSSTAVRANKRKSKLKAKRRRQRVPAIS